MSSNGYHICLLSIHGLIRGQNLELGRDADTGGQVLYVVELARALAGADEVRQVDLVTRLIDTDALRESYGQEEEPIGDKARILRIRCGGDGYLPKERLWDHVDVMADNLIEHYAEEDSRPDLIHTHYADGGYVGTRLAHLLGIPLVHTGHSLGRVKRRRLLSTGLSSNEIEKRYNMARRIEAEENTLATAVRVITSTHQEIEQQYQLYDFYRKEAMSVIPPGTNLERFVPPQGGEQESEIAAAVQRFLKEPKKPMILALSRADARKNIAALVHAYGNSEALQQKANLVLVMGNRDDVAELEEGARDVLTEILQLIDRYDLYGKVAVPKHHASDDVPVLYRLATLSGGVFVNPALTEPFGLTLIEAAACGLPIVATEDGGPIDIVENCKNGILIDPLETDSIRDAIESVLGDWERWQERSVEGLKGVREFYSWNAHVSSYLEMIEPIIAKAEKAPQPSLSPERETLYADRALFTDLNLALLGDEEALAKLLEVIRDNRPKFLFGICTGLRFDSALRLLRKHDIPEPDVLISSAGTSITIAPKLNEDNSWKRYIERQWTPQVVRRVLDEIPGLEMRDRDQQSEFKVSYQYDPDEAPPIDDIRAKLYEEDQAVNVFYSHGKYLNVIPIRASKGLALRYVVGQFNLPLEKVLAIGASGADIDMMRGNTLAGVVANAALDELSEIHEGERIFVAESNNAAGILEAMDYYDFLGACEAPEKDGDEDGTGAETPEAIAEEAAKETSE